MTFVPSFVKIGKLVQKFDVQDTQLGDLVCNLFYDAVSIPGFRNWEPHAAPSMHFGLPQAAWSYQEISPPGPWLARVLYRKREVGGSYVQSPYSYPKDGTVFPPQLAVVLVQPLFLGQLVA